MGDRHLNLFYTYNRDSGLIENNLTRAFIVFLSIVSSKTRQKVLSTLLNAIYKSSQEDRELLLEKLDFPQS